MNVINVVQQGGSSTELKSKRKVDAAITIDNLNNNIATAKCNQMTYHRLEKKYMEITVSQL